MLRPLHPQGRPDTHCIGGWVDSRAGLDGCGKSRPPTGIRSPDRPARSESLYTLRYPGPPADDISVTSTSVRFEESSYVHDVTDIAPYAQNIYIGTYLLIFNLLN